MTSTQGFDTFLNKLHSFDNIDSKVNKAVEKTLMQMYNRAARRPFTPIDTGELKNSRSVTQVVNGSGEFGYNKEYAKRIEYGGRDKKGRYIAPRAYLQQNVNRAKIDLKNNLKNVFEDD